MRRYPLIGEIPIFFHLVLLQMLLGKPLVRWVTNTSAWSGLDFSKQVVLKEFKR